MDDRSLKDRGDVSRCRTYSQISSILLELTDSRARRRLLFSGDLGNAGRPLLRTPAPPPKVDVVVMESTYGDRLHKPFAPSVEQFYAAIPQTVRAGRQRGDPKVCAGACAGVAVLPAQRRRNRSTAPQAARLAVFSTGPRVVGFSIRLAACSSWYANA